MFLQTNLSACFQHNTYFFLHFIKKSFNIGLFISTPSYPRLWAKVTIKVVLRTRVTQTATWRPQARSRPQQSSHRPHQTPPMAAAQTWPVPQGAAPIWRLPMRATRGRPLRPRVVQGRLARPQTRSGKARPRQTRATSRSEDVAPTSQVSFYLLSVVSDRRMSL